jgi:NADPH:quinone reductase-like Zn-dependent oxidoreductase/acyl carrier protein
VDLDPAAPEACLERLVEELLAPDQEDQIALRPSGRWAPRLLRSSAAGDRLRWPDAGGHRLAPGSDRTLAGLHFETLEMAAPGPGQVQVRVHAAGLNFRDVLDALGMVPVPIGALGSELAGEVIAVGEGVEQFAVGDRVVGLASGTFANRLNVPARLLAKLPTGISFVQGATIPVAFVTAELALQRLQLRAGQRILIHAASGGVGLAAVQLAQAQGAEVFATASRPKQTHLRSIGVSHVFDSRCTGFAEGILEATGGQGVDAVLNSLTGEGFIAATLSALAQGGRFVELSKRDVWAAQRMQAERPDVDYHILALESSDAMEQSGRALGQLMERFSSGHLKTLPLRVWPLCEAQAAFRWMQQARHIGKIVLRMPPLLEGRFHAEGTYLITGGLGGLGLEVARWMVERGAMHLVLNGRRPPDREAEITLAQLREAGAEVRVVLGDVSQDDEARRIVRQIDDSAAPLRGVIHAAGVLRDGALLNQDWQRFAEVLAPKTLGAWRLHALTADLDLDLFVLFSSGVVLFGNRGQANHAAANTFLDALAHHRRAAGLPAVSIDWGAWSDVGAAARRDLAGQLSQGGFGWITPEQGLAALERALVEDRAQLGVIPVDWEVFARQPAAEGSGRFLETFLASGPPSSARVGTGGDLWRRLRHLPAEEHLPALTSFVQDEVARVLRLQSPPDVQTGFADLGMDSLMAVELRNRLQSQLGQQVRLSSTLAFDYPTTAALADHLLTLSQSDQQTSAFDRPGMENVEQQGGPPDQLDHIDSESELDVLLSEKVSQILRDKHARTKSE